jgi:hypothetical protein
MFLSSQNEQAGDYPGLFVLLSMAILHPLAFHRGSHRTWIFLSLRGAKRRGNLPIRRKFPDIATLCRRCVREAAPYTHLCNMIPL